MNIVSLLTATCRPTKLILGSFIVCCVFQTSGAKLVRTERVTETSLLKQLRGNRDIDHGRSFYSSSNNKLSNIHNFHKDRTLEESNGLPRFEIGHDGLLQVQDRNDPDEKDIVMNYIVSRNDDTINHVLLYYKDCKEPLPETLLTMDYTETPQTSSIVTRDPKTDIEVKVLYKDSNVDTSQDFWEAATNEAGSEIGFDFSYCMTLNMTDTLSGEVINFIETVVNVYVDKTNGLGFSLNVAFEREAPGVENAVINYDADIDAKLCNTVTREEIINPAPLKQGGSVGLCVESKTDGIDVIGWDNLTLSKDDGVKVYFDAIENGSVPPKFGNLVDQSCHILEKYCIADVRLIASFFDSPESGQIKVTGTMVVDASDRRHLLEVDVSDIINDYQRKLNGNNNGEGSFKLSLETAGNIHATQPSSSAISMVSPQLIFAGIATILGALYNMI